MNIQRFTAAIILRLIMVVILVVLMAYNISIFFGENANPSVEPPLRYNETAVTSSFHANGYEDARVDVIDLKQRLVLVQIIDTKLKISFRSSKLDLNRFHKGWIAPVTFECGQKPGDKCDLSRPYKLYVSNRLVKPEDIIEIRK